MNLRQEINSTQEYKNYMNSDQWNKVRFISSFELIKTSAFKTTELARALISKEGRFNICESIYTKHYPEPEESLYNKHVATIFFIKNNKINVTCQFTKIEHELSHILEMQDLSRICLDDFGIQTTVPKKNCNAMMKALVRETRVKAIELFFKEKNPVIHDIQDILSGVYEHCYHIILKEFNKFDNNQNKLDLYLYELAKSTISKWSIDRIHHDFDIKLDIMRNHMETNVN